MSTEIKTILKLIESNLRAELQGSIDTIDNLTKKNNPALSDAINSHLISGVLLGKLATVVEKTISSLPDVKENKEKK